MLEERFDFGVLSLATNIFKDLLRAKDSASALGIQTDMQHRS